MIYVSVGTEKFPFDRLLKRLDLAVENNEIRQPVYAQIGCSEYKPKNYGYKDRMPFEEMVENINKSNIIVLHAGIGSTLLALSLGKIPILFPRKACYNEHLDDHQIEFAKKIRTTKKLLVAFTEEELIESINSYQDLIDGLYTSSSLSSKLSLAGYLKKTYLR